ncbi:MAG: biotin--[acetyl-CoA-carboxylase] ligase [Paludibacteraceae bacterium]|nr:biotin--[acetyl-CoA-carboxylase] ligase [Paludibacteraceae bacterium]
MTSALFKYESLSSTNTELSILLTDSLPEFSVVISDYQTEGRGQVGAYWESEKGANLLFSMLFYPHFLSVKDFFLLSQFTSLALIDFFNQCIPSAEFTIKWPNDIYYQDKKIAGILIENSIQGSKISSSIVGIGLNVNQTHFISDAPNPISLALITGKQYSLSTLFENLQLHLRFRYNQLMSRDYFQLRSDYHRRLYRLGCSSLYEDATGTFEAVLDSVANDGQLCLKLQSGESRFFYMKEVQFLFDR